MNRKIDLEGRIEQYGTTAQGQIGHRYTIGEIAGYAAAVGAGFAMAGTADAAIVYSGVLNKSVSIDPTRQATTTTTYFQQSSTAKFAIGSANVRASVSFFGAVSRGPKYVGEASLFAPSNLRFMTTGIKGSGGARLASNALISRSASFKPRYAGLLRKEGSTAKGPTSFNYGLFSLSTTGFLGFQLTGPTNNGDVGWIKVKIEDLGPNQPFSSVIGGPLLDGKGFPDQLTVMDWAYTDGSSIRAGQTTVPDPSSLALLAAGALGLAAFRRRKAARAN